MTITPNDVKQKRNTIDAAEASAGARSGRVSRSRRCAPDAPSVAAASHRRRSSPAQNAPTTRTTTATLKKTCASRIAHTDRSTPSGRSAMNAVATTTVGRTNGTSTNASTTERPRKRNRDSAHASGRPAASVSAVETVACQRVNHSTSRVRPLVTTPQGTSSRPSTTRLRRRIATSGHAKKSARKAIGTAAVAVRLSVRRCPSTGRPSGRGSRRSPRAEAGAGPSARRRSVTNASGSGTPDRTG